MYHYALRCDRLFNEHIGTYVTYGVDVLDENWHCILTVRDVSVEKDAVAALVCSFERLQPAPVHIMDIIEDFLGSCP